jgi:hypothetical protein
VDLKDLDPEHSHRQRRLRKLKKSVASRQYHVSSDEIARRMICQACEEAAARQREDRSQDLPDMQSLEVEGGEESAN